MMKIKLKVIYMITMFSSYSSNKKKQENTMEMYFPINRK